MRRRNMRETRHCNSGALTRPAAILAGLALAIGLVVSAALPATGSVRPVPHAGTPGLGDDVYFYRPSIQSVPQKPPLDTLIRFKTEVYTNYTPQAFHVVMHLYRWRSAMQLKRPKGAWVEIHPTVRYGLAELPAVGHHEQLQPPAQWTCETGRLYVRVHIFGITHNGKPDGATLYFPWKGYNRKKLSKGNNHKPPSLRQAWHTGCQGDDTLIG